MQTAHNALSVSQLVINTFHIGISRSIGQAHGFQTLAADFVQLERVNQQADNLIRRHLEKLLGRSQLRYQRHVGNLNLLMCQIHTQRSFGGTGNADNNNVRLQQAQRIFAVIVFNSKFHSLNTLEVFVVQRVNQTGLIFRQQTGRLFDGFQHRSQNVNYLNITAHSLVRHMLAQLRRYDCVADNRIICCSLFYNFINLFLVLYVRNTDNIKFFFYELTGGCLNYGLRSFTNRVRYSINNRIKLRYYDNYPPYPQPDLPADE